jgi:hypothetical protein
LFSLFVREKKMEDMNSLNRALKSPLQSDVGAIASPISSPTSSSSPFSASFSSPANASDRQTFVSGSLVSGSLVSGSLATGSMVAIDAQTDMQMQKRRQTIQEELRDRKGPLWNYLKVHYEMQYLKERLAALEQARDTLKQHVTERMNLLGTNDILLEHFLSEDELREVGGSGLLKMTSTDFFSKRKAGLTRNWTGTSLTRSMVENAVVQGLISENQDEVTSRRKLKLWIQNEVSRLSEKKSQELKQLLDLQPRQGAGSAPPVFKSTYVIFRKYATINKGRQGLGNSSSPLTAVPAMALPTTMLTAGIPAVGPHNDMALLTSLSPKRDKKPPIKKRKVSSSAAVLQSQGTLPTWMPTLSAPFVPSSSPSPSSSPPTASSSPKSPQAEFGFQVMT